VISPVLGGVLMSAVDPQVAAVLAALQEGAPPLASLTPAQVRAWRAQNPPPPDLRFEVAGVQDRTVPGPVGQLGVRIYHPLQGPGAASPPVVAFFHGGGFVLGDIESHDGQARMLCALARCVVVSVEYRLAPEAPFPAAVEDTIAATHWVITHAESLGADPGRVAVAGDSAGANLAAVAAQQLRGAEVELAGQLLVYPTTGGGQAFDSHRDNAAGPGLDAATLQWFHDHYAADAEDVRYAPLRAESLAGLAPAVIGVAGFDPLRDEGIAYAHALEQAGVTVVLRHYEELVHGFFGMGAFSAAADRASRQLCQDFAALLGTS
jgi:acetyl esterase